jgi:hypothetical protein
MLWLDLFDNIVSNWKKLILVGRSPFAAQLILTCIQTFQHVKANQDPKAGHFM